MAPALPEMKANATVVCCAGAGICAPKSTARALADAMTRLITYGLFEAAGRAAL